MLIALAVLIVAGCETSPQTAVPTNSPTRASDPHEENAPLLLSLNALSDEGGVLLLQARLDSRSGVSLPVELSVELPPGASLLDGSSRESVPVPAGRTTRNFRIQYGEKRTPIKVIAHVVHPDRAWGIHAEKFYPEKPEKLISVSPQKPPIARPPVAPIAPVAHTKEAP